MTWKAVDDHLPGLPTSFALTGGTGALGLLISQWLGSKGVRKLILASRSGRVQAWVVRTHPNPTILGLAGGESRALVGLGAWQQLCRALRLRRGTGSLRRGAEIAC